MRTWPIAEVLVARSMTIGALSQPERKCNRVCAKQRIDPASGMHSYRMGIGKDHSHQAGVRHDLGIVAKPEDIAAADKGDSADPGIARFLDRKICREDAGRMAWTAITVDARGRCRFMRDLYFWPSVQTARAQFAHGRVDMIRPLDMMTMQIGVHRAFAAQPCGFVVTTGCLENACEKVAQDGCGDGDGLACTHFESFAAI